MTHYVYWYHLPEQSNKAEGYVGVTMDLAARHYMHSTGRTTKHIANAFNKYGNKIIKEILLEGTLNDCLALEAQLRPRKNIGWNIAIGGGMAPDCTGNKHTKSTKAKISKGNIGKNLGKLSKFKGTTGRWSDEQKAKIGEYHKGKQISEKHKQAIAEKNSGKNHCKSKQVTLVHKDNPTQKYVFDNMRIASEELKINYASLREQARKRKDTFNRKGWKVLHMDLCGG